MQQQMMQMSEALQSNKDNQEQSAYIEQLKGNIDGLVNNPIS